MTILYVNMVYHKNWKHKNRITNGIANNNYIFYRSCCCCSIQMSMFHDKNNECLSSCPHTGHKLTPSHKRKEKTRLLNCMVHTYRIFTCQSVLLVDVLSCLVGCYRFCCIVVSVVCDCCWLFSVLSCLVVLRGLSWRGSVVNVGIAICCNCCF